MNCSVSVVIPTYNRCDLLQHAIGSVRRQTHSVSEIIVVDDGSTDSTLDWCTTQSDIQTLRSNRRGPAAARNMGVKASRSDWIAFLDSDDVWMEHHLARVAEIIQAEPDTQMIICNFLITNADLEELQGVQGFVAAYPAFHKSKTLFSFLFPAQGNTDVWHGNAQRQALFGNWMQPSGLVIRRTLFQDLGGFNERLWRCEDMEFLLRLVNHTHVTMIKTPSYYWRQQQDNSLAADPFVLHLKRDGLRIMTTTGLLLAIQNKKFPIFWCATVLWMTLDLLSARLLRFIRSLETDPSHQTMVQSTIAIANVAVPICLARWLSLAEFAHYRIFSVYLSSVTALSLTAGLWSLIPHWSAKGSTGVKMISAAWKSQCLAAVACFFMILILAPLGQSPQTFPFNISLALSTAFLLPSVFLEQRLSLMQKGLIGSIAVASVELFKAVCLLYLSLQHHSLLTILMLVPCFISVRFFCLIFITKRLRPFAPTDIHGQELKTVFFSALPIGLSAALATLASVFDRFYLSQHLSPEDFAMIGVGTFAFPIASLLEQSTIQHSMQKLAIHLCARQTDECAGIIRSNIEKISKFTIPYSISLALFAPEILQLFFAGRYAEAEPVMRVFALSHLLSCIPPDAISRAQGHANRILMFSFLSASTAALFVIAGYHLCGPAGAIAGGLLASFLFRATLLWFDLHRVDIRPASLLPQLDWFQSVSIHLAFIATLKFISTQMNISPLLSLTAILLVLFNAFKPELLRKKIFTKPESEVN